MSGVELANLDDESLKEFFKILAEKVSNESKYVVILNCISLCTSPSYLFVYTRYHMISLALASLSLPLAPLVSFALHCFALLCFALLCFACLLAG